MTAPFILVGAIAILGLFACMWRWFANAPLGYEDETGFHIGEPDE